MKINWNNTHHVHFVGIKGVAMTALAVWAKEKGYTVTGSDVAEEFPTDEVLRKNDIPVSIGFSSDHVAGDLVIYTGAHAGRDNVEVKEAIRKGIPAFSHGKALGDVMSGYRQISVAGCHGKTTTTAMIATMLNHAGLDPSYAIGSGTVRGLGLPGHAGTGAWFIAEADEYVTDPGHDNTPRFLWQKPEILVVTAIDFDHPDVYADIDAVARAYISFVEQSPNNRLLIFNNSDDNNQKYLHDQKPFATYGSINADVTVHKEGQKPFQNMGRFRSKDEEIQICLKVPGMHNLLNAAGAYLAGKHIGIETNCIIEGLEKYEGASRRFEYVGKKDGVTIIDDYAHHPTEIQATLMAAREWYPEQNIIALFQPHTYTRTRALLHEFGPAFSEANQVKILPIYASARETQQTIEPDEVVTEIKKHHTNVSFHESLESFFSVYSKNAISNDVILCLGAGDIGRKMREIINR